MHSYRKMQYLRLVWGLQRLSFNSTCKTHTYSYVAYIVSITYIIIYMTKLLHSDWSRFIPIHSDSKDKYLYFCQVSSKFVVAFLVEKSIDCFEKELWRLFAVVQLINIQTETFWQYGQHCNFVMDIINK